MQSPKFIIDDWKGVRSEAVSQMKAAKLQLMTAEYMYNLADKEVKKCEKKLSSNGTNGSKAS